MERWARVALVKGYTRRAKSVAYAGLFFLVGTLFQIVTWVALFVGLRESLLLVMRRAVHAVLVFVFGILVAVRQLAFLRQASYVLLFFSVAILMPVLIWLGLALAIRDLLNKRRESRLASTLLCRFDTDCLPGFVCIAGRCVPLY